VLDGIGAEVKSSWPFWIGLQMCYNDKNKNKVVIIKYI